MNGSIAQRISLKDIESLSPVLLPLRKTLHFAGVVPARSTWVLWHSMIVVCCVHCRSQDVDHWRIWRHPATRRDISPTMSYIAQALSVANELQHDFATLLVQFLHTEAYKVWPETDPSHAAIDCRNEHESDWWHVWGNWIVCVYVIICYWYIYIYIYIFI